MFNTNRQETEISVYSVAGNVDLQTVDGSVVDGIYEEFRPPTAEEIAAAVNAGNEVETVFRILLHSAANDDHGVRLHRKKPFTSSRFSAT